MQEATDVWHHVSSNCFQSKEQEQISHFEELCVQTTLCQV